MQSLCGNCTGATMRVSALHLHAFQKHCARSNRAGVEQVRAKLRLEPAVLLIQCSVLKCRCMAEALYLSPGNLEPYFSEPF
jgi:hypothetical protein